MSGNPSEKKTTGSKFWAIFVVLLIAFGIIRFVANRIDISATSLLIVKLVAAAITTVVVIFCFRRFAR